MAEKGGPIVGSDTHEHPFSARQPQHPRQSAPLEEAEAGRRAESHPAGARALDPRRRHGAAQRELRRPAATDPRAVGAGAAHRQHGVPPRASARVPRRGPRRDRRALLAALLQL